MDEFYTLSQLAISIAGFAALFSILKPKTDSYELTDKLNLIRFYVMIELACMVVILCYLPIILLGYFNPEITYKLSFLTFLILSGIYHVFAMKRNKRVSKKINIGGISTIIIRILTIIGFIFAIFNLTGVISSQFRENYLMLIFLIFSMDIYFFIRLIYFSIGKKADL
ncbi:hypothetical protein G5B37_03970 [Rasiella rasia]|uniref:Uncharacterized protein n=1 Tax=Rasiella rasia TaxID=2744027 RepID=A0A6G6GJH8_9FLAO|nr:hypothetical protein [Rasiella rasia]QIE58746.1 hypothetical protein G5B37_03970 [Rasiella rasia]